MSKNKRSTPRSRQSATPTVDGSTSSGSVGFRKRIRDITPFSPAQKEFFEYYESGFNLMLSGAAGCGKTFIALYKALEESRAASYRKKVVVVRSVVPTRDMGFLPGTQQEKEAAYITPYKAIVSDLYGEEKAWESLVSRGALTFMTTSYIRGITLDNSIVIVDEAQNCNFHELDSIITRIGQGSRIIFAGDYYQSDFHRDSEKDGIKAFTKILRKMNYFKEVNFGWEDIVRSGIVRDYIMTKELLERDGETPSNHE